MKIGYFADGPWAHEAFKRLIQDQSIEIVFICVRFDRNDEVLNQYAKEYDIDLLSHSNVNSDEFYGIVQKYGADLFVSMSFNQIFRERVINLPPMKTINCHAGKLPYYRGRNILNWALINDEKEFGITVHYVDEGIDTGDIILQETYPITDEDDYGTLLKRAYVGCADVLYRAIKLMQRKECKPIKQDSIDKIGMYCGMRQPGDELLDWNQTSREIFNFVRAICKPGPCARTYIGNQEVRINKVRMVESARDYIGIPGQVIGKTQEGFWVKTKDNFIEVIEYQGIEKVKMGDRFAGGYSPII